jgi:hypothetical protein
MNNKTNIAKNKILPNFLIIGAFKSGTNSLYHYLEPHPQVFMSPRKKPSFFAFEGQNISDNQWTRNNVITQFNDYIKLFEEAEGKDAIGEASPYYLVSTQAPAKIKYYLPKVNLVAILRNPVDRAYSQWQMEFRQGTEKISNFASAVQVRQTDSDGSIRQRFVYGSKYYSLLKRYYDIFDRSQICVLLFDQLITDRNGLLKKIYHFLEVDPKYVPENISVQYNEGGLPRNSFTGFFTQKIYPYIAEIKTILPQGIRERVIAQSRRFKKSFWLNPLNFQQDYVLNWLPCSRKIYYSFKT